MPNDDSNGMIYFIIITTALAIWITLFVSTAYLVAKHHASLARKAIQLGREDVARTLFSSLRPNLFGKVVCLFLPQDLKKTYLQPLDKS